MFENIVAKRLSRQKIHDDKIAGAGQRGGYKAMNQKAKKRQFDKFRQRENTIQAKRANLVRKATNRNRGIGI